ncbi:helix-turn-helix domain-containing protein [Pseudarthrobacter psychrotolerans]|uniref:Helix-turn-helix domain-containing protein n=1 Tax=Pseudarthrobacter psychrotolerans TaxID=2697569 RepID=A0A6P1ND94_9MICC|nr:helix-turn-helix domain-containing protein [Pseudarthrobacter psychrotolerans]QHK18555.1 helix-turn-helix domain-containing protein [Pseudarthrobacter psychrotolerans]
MPERLTGRGAIKIVRRPADAVESVDNALQLLTMLREGTVRVSDAAQRLGVAPSTAHRLLATLAYQGFALHDESRRYMAGPALLGQSSPDELLPVTGAAMRHLQNAAVRTGETISLGVRTGAQMRLVWTVESRRLVRVGDRSGTILPARLSSGGQALLASLDGGTVNRLYSGHSGRIAGDQLGPLELASLLSELMAVRSRGYARNIGLTEPDIAAIGMAVPDAGRPAWLSVSAAAPIARAAALESPESLAALRDCCSAVAADLAEIGQVGD